MAVAVIHYIRWTWKNKRNVMRDIVGVDELVFMCLIRSSWHVHTGLKHVKTSSRSELLIVTNIKHITVCTYRIIYFQMGAFKSPAERVLLLLYMQSSSTHASVCTVVYITPLFFGSYAA